MFITQQWRCFPSFASLKSPQKDKFETPHPNYVKSIELLFLNTPLILGTKRFTFLAQYFAFCENLLPVLKMEFYFPNYLA